MTARAKENGLKDKITEHVSSTNPYEMFGGTQVWKIVEKTINDLVDNNDIIEKTQRDYIVGYICKDLQGIVTAEPDHSNN